MHCPIEWLPASGPAEQLILLLHDAGADGTAMLPLAQVLRAEFPKAAILAPDAPDAADVPDVPNAAHAAERQWFSVDGIAHAGRSAQVSAAVQALRAWIRATQDSLRLPPVTTALAGHGQGATLALETALADDGIAGRVLAFGGRFAGLPQAAPRHTTLHLFHGADDPVVPARQASLALEVLGTLQGDATLDIADGVGHALHPALLQRAVFRLRNHIPARTWAAALGSVPAMHGHNGPND